MLRLGCAIAVVLLGCFMGSCHGQVCGVSQCLDNYTQNAGTCDDQLDTAFFCANDAYNAPPTVCPCSNAVVTQFNSYNNQYYNAPYTYVGLRASCFDGTCSASQTQCQNAVDILNAGFNPSYCNDVVPTMIQCVDAYQANPVDLRDCGSANYFIATMGSYMRTSYSETCGIIDCPASTIVANNTMDVPVGSCAAVEYYITSREGITNDFNVQIALGVCTNIDLQGSLNYVDQQIFINEGDCTGTQEFIRIQNAICTGHID